MKASGRNPRPENPLPLVQVPLPSSAGAISPTKPSPTSTGKCLPIRAIAETTVLASTGVAIVADAAGGPVVVAAVAVAMAVAGAAAGPEAAVAGAAVLGAKGKYKRLQPWLQ